MYDSLNSNFIKYNKFVMRVIIDNESVMWSNGRDVADFLEYNISNMLCNRECQILKLLP